jgi:hypothetical protein
MVFLLLFNLWPRLLPIGRGLSEDWVDGIRGMLLGVAAGLICWAAALIGRQRRKDLT